MSKNKAVWSEWNVKIIRLNSRVPEQKFKISGVRLHTVASRAICYWMRGGRSMKAGSKIVMEIEKGRPIQTKFGTLYNGEISIRDKILERPGTCQGNSSVSAGSARPAT
jgi:hypothetical protein